MAPSNIPQPLEGPLLVADSSQMRDIRTRIITIASIDSTVLITGETGTGKELVADLIHRNSRRRKQPFVCINCSAIPDSLLESEMFGYERGAFTGAHSLNEGRLKQAEGGTAFFDEIGDMSLYAQAKILRMIETKKIDRLGGRGGIPLDVRVIAATNQDLEKSVAEGKFREDLYFRLNVVRFHLPPLRDRKEDIPLLIDHYLQAMNRQFNLDVEGFSLEALERLFHYHWPGNVRELKNLLEAIFANLPSRKVSLGDMPEHFRRRTRECQAVPPSELDRVMAALFDSKWNKSKAAQLLRWSRTTLYRKIAKYRLIPGDTKEDTAAAKAESEV